MSLTPIKHQTGADGDHNGDRPTASTEVPSFDRISDAGSSGFAATRTIPLDEVAPRDPAPIPMEGFQPSVGPLPEAWEHPWANWPENTVRTT